MLYLGDNQPTIYLGDNTPNIYLGDNQVYPMGPFVGIKIKRKIEFNHTTPFDYNLTVSMKLKSSEAWTLSTDADWLSLSQTTGDPTNGTIINVSATTQSASTQAVISAITANYSASCLCVFNTRVIPPNNTIWYISKDGIAHDPSRPANWFAGTDGNALQSYTNTYSGGYGSIVFNDDLGVLAGNAFSHNTYYNTMWFPDTLFRATDESFYNVENMIVYYGTGLTTIDKSSFPMNGKIYIYATTCPTLNMTSNQTPWTPYYFEAINGELHYPNGSDYSALIAKMPSTWTAIGDL